MTDRRLDQIVRALEMAQRPTQIDDTESWQLRLWKSCVGVATVPRDEDLLFHETLTLMSQTNPQGRIAEDCLAAALAAARDIACLSSDSEIAAQ